MLLQLRPFNNSLFSIILRHSDFAWYGIAYGMFVTFSQNILNLAVCPRSFLNFLNFVTYKRRQLDEKLLAHFFVK